MNRFTNLLKALECLEASLECYPMTTEESTTAYEVMEKAKAIALKHLKDALVNDLDKMFAKAVSDAKTDIDD